MKDVVQGSCFCGSTTTVTLHSCRMLPYLWIPAYATCGARVWCEGKTQMIWILDYLIGQFMSGFTSRASRVTAFLASRVTAFFASRVELPRVTAFFVGFKSHCFLRFKSHCFLRQLQESLFSSGCTSWVNHGSNNEDWAPRAIRLPSRSYIFFPHEALRLLHNVRGTPSATTNSETEGLWPFFVFSRK